MKRMVLRMREYDVYYRERGNKVGAEFNCTVTCNTKEEARKNFEQWDNQNKEWTITRIERV